MNRVLIGLLLSVMTMLPAARRQSAVVMRDVPYTTKPSPDQMMDVYWAGTTRPGVLFIHGGSLQETGERRSSQVYREVCKPFVAADISCATMDYRLAPASQWPAMPNDVAAAVAKLRELITQRGGDPKRLFLFGHSSGCHLAAIVGTNPDYLKTVDLAPTDLAGIIPMGCTLDRDDAAIRRTTPNAIRAAFQNDAGSVATFGTPENYLAANPAGFLGAHVPPVLVVVARNERFTPAILEQGARFVRRLVEMQKVADLVIVPGRHMSSIGDIGKAGDPTFAAVRAFIENPLSVKQ